MHPTAGEGGGVNHQSAAFHNPNSIYHQRRGNVQNNRVDNNINTKRKLLSIVDPVSDGKRPKLFQDTITTAITTTTTTNNTISNIVGGTYNPTSFQQDIITTRHQSSSSSFLDNNAQHQKNHSIVSQKSKSFVLPKVDESGRRKHVAMGPAKDIIVIKKPRAQQQHHTQTSIVSYTNYPQLLNDIRQQCVLNSTFAIPCTLLGKLVSPTWKQHKESLTMRPLSMGNRYGGGDSKKRKKRATHSGYNRGVETYYGPHGYGDDDELSPPNLSGFPFKFRDSTPVPYTTVYPNQQQQQQQHQQQRDDSLAWCLYFHDDNTRMMHIPRYYGLQHFGILDTSRNYTTTGTLLEDNKEMKFNSTLRPLQVSATTAVLSALCDPKRPDGGILSLPCGCGKTVCALYIHWALRIRGKRMKTLVLVHKNFLLEQWIENINIFLPGLRVGRIQGDNVDVDQCDIVVGMVQSIYQRPYSQSIFQTFGLCIVDEAHRFASKMYSRAILKVVSRYTLSLSATLRKKDGTTRAIEWLMGPILYSTKRAPMSVYCKLVGYDGSMWNRPSEFQEPVRFARSGELNLPQTVNQLSMNRKRNTLAMREILYLFQRYYTHVAYTCNRNSNDIVNPILSECSGSNNNNNNNPNNTDTQTVSYYANTNVNMYTIQKRKIILFSDRVNSKKTPHLRILKDMIWPALCRMVRASFPPTTGFRLNRVCLRSKKTFMWQYVRKLSPVTQSNPNDSDNMNVSSPPSHPYYRNHQYQSIQSHGRQLYHLHDNIYESENAPTPPLNPFVVRTKISDQAVGDEDEIAEITVSFYIGDMSGEERKLAECADILLSSFALANEGLDIPEADTALIVSPHSDVVQASGRVLRFHPNKYVPLIIYVVDRFCDQFVNAAASVKRFFKGEGYRIAMEDWNDYGVYDIEQFSFVACDYNGRLIDDNPHVSLV